MSLPLQAVERLFTRLQATYGRDFMARYEGTETNAVKASWAHELSGFANDLHSLAWALEHLPERAPNVIEFRKIARQAPTPEVPRIEHDHAGRGRIAAEMAKLAPVLASRPRVTHGFGSKAWAELLRAKDEASPSSVSPAVRAMYRAALGILTPSSVAA